MSARKYFCGGSAIVLAAALGFAQSASAQDAEVEEVIVTGSYIAGTPEDAALPVDVLSSEELEKQGSPTIVQLVKTITASQSALGESNRYNGGAGTASINLRGFGASRTLVLMNGTRVGESTAVAFQGGGADLNAIPQAAVGRVEILKDGAAATYGSEAIGGVVNFITRKDLDGFEFEGEYAFIDGSDGDWNANAAWGKKFDAGNILLTAGYRRRSRLDIHERDFTVKDFDFGGYNGSGGWTGAANPGFYVQNNAAGTFIFRDNGCGELGGTLTNTIASMPNPLAGQPGQAATIANVPVPVSAQSPQAATSTCRFQFSNFNDIVNLEHHYNFYGEVNADLNETTTFHAEAAWSRSWVPNQRLSPANLSTQFPTPISAGGTSGSLATPGALNFFVRQNVPSYHPGLVDLRTTCAAPLTAVQCTAMAAAGGVDVSQTVWRAIAFAGHPTNPDKSDHQDIEVTRYRVSAGLKGELPWLGGINYDASMTFNENKGEVSTNDLLVTRIQLALNGFGSLSTDPGSCAPAERTVANAGNAAVGCYFFNPFTNSVATSAVTGQANPFYRGGANAALNNDPRLVEWLYGNYVNIATNQSFGAGIVFSGETGIELGGGQVAWAAGGQWRWNRDDNRYGDLFNNQKTPCVDSIDDGTPICGAPSGPFIFFGSNSDTDIDRSVGAVFGETRIPILDNLEVNLAVRYEKYPGSIGSTTNPKVSARWQVVDWLALRGSWGTTFRAPGLVAATTICSVGVANLGGQYRAVRTCGNPDLVPETADSYNAGIVFELGGFSATLDYFKFDFEKELTIESSARLFATMFPAGAPANCGIAPLAARFQFAGGVCAAANVLRMDIKNVNGPGTKTSGLDFRAQYDIDDFLLDGSSWTVGVEATYLIEYKRGAFTLTEDPTLIFAPAEDRAGLHDLTSQFFSYPELRGNGWLTFNRGPLTARWQIRYTEGTSPAFGTTLFYTVPDASQPSGRRLEPYGKSDDFWQHDVTVRYELPWDMVLTASIQNVFDKDPPELASQYNYDYTNGNALGRVFEVGFRKRF